MPTEHRFATAARNLAVGHVLADDEAGPLIVTWVDRVSGWTIVVAEPIGAARVSRCFPDDQTVTVLDHAWWHGPERPNYEPF